jgi:type IV secretory pathway VirB3-like protein
MNTKMPLYRGMTIDKTVRGLPRNIFYSLCMAGMISVALFNNVYMLIPFSLIYFVLKAINKKDSKVLENFIRRSLKKYISY